ncbi:hypothetical protein LTR85_004435 [Meristemomyces frigidus]|nr:hypothetical protein LTR85_004435 [Meristemomyces frigidus]
MAPKKGKETPLELCTITISMGNSIAVHLLEYLSDVANPRHGFRALAIEFLEASRALFPAKTGLTEATRSRTQFPAELTNELRELLRRYNDNFVVLRQMVDKLLENERKQGFGKLGRGFRMMFADTEMEKMRMSLAQCREASRKDALIFNWTIHDAQSESTTGIGYTALAAVLERPDPTQGRTPDVIPLASTTSHTSTERPSFPPERSTSQMQGTPGGSRRDLNAPESPQLGRRSSVGTAFGTGSSRATTVSNTFSHGGHGSGDDMSDITLPTPPPTQIDDMLYPHEADDTVPKQAIRVKIDPTSVTKWKPNRGAGAIPAGARAALVTAVQEQNHKMVEHLLDSGVPPDNGPERNLLRVAVANHDIDSVRLLLLFGADANAGDIVGLTPLYTATEALFFEAAQLLLKYGANPNLSAGTQDETPFSLSLSDGRAHLAQLYLKHGADPDVLMGNGDTPFVHAMNKSTASSLVDWMLVYDANPNKKNGHGETPLFAAINAERLDLVTLLLDRGADTNLPGPKHMLWPAVHRPQILELLLKRGANLQRAPGVLELATSINSPQAVDILLKYGADPNAKKDGIFTPLCTAIRDDRGSLVDIMLASGADPNLPASEYPASKCVTHHRAHLLPRLLAAGADPNNPKGIIETAVAHKNKAALILLLEANVNPNTRNKAGNTALTTAIRNNDMESIEILLAHGADPGVLGQEWPISMAVKSPQILGKLLPCIATNKIPKGSLEMAVQADQLESVKLLLAKGVDVEEKNGGVFSPLTTSIREDRKAIFQFLLDEAGADPNSPGEHLPIIKAIRRHRENDLSYVKQLLVKGADINLMYRGWNAVLQALDKGDTQILRLLADLGTPDVHARDEDGNSVLDNIHDRGMAEEEQILLRSSKSSPKMNQAFSQLRDFVKQ